MSRRHRAEKREINPDPKFGDLVVSKFMNSLMKDGKKSSAESIVYGAFDVVEEPPSRTRSRSSTPRWTTFVRRSKSVRVVSVVPPIRCRSKCAPSASRRWPSAG